MNFSYIDILNQEYQKKVSSNKYYSIRAFARDIGINPGNLSQIMNGKRPLGENWAQKICDLLQLSENRKGEFLNSAKLSRVNLSILKNIKPILKNKKINESDINDNLLKLLEKWEYQAILNLIELRRFSAESYDALSNLLGTNLNTLSDLVLLLIEEDLITINNDGYFERVHEGLEVVGQRKYFLDIIQRFQYRTILKSLTKLDSPLCEVEFIGSTFKIPRSKVPEAKQLVKEFVSSLSNYFQCSKETPCNTVYQLNVQLFSLLEEDL